MNENKTSLTVALIGLNEELRLPKVLESIKEIADEIILIDSGSSDNTVKIAESYGAKVFIKSWNGFAAQKNLLLSKCSCDWILYLDCDEVVSPNLCQEIIKTINSPISLDGYFINRRTCYLGKILNHSWQPDFKLRLVKKSAAPNWVGEYVHESLNIEGKTGYLNNEITHYSYKNIFDHMEKTLKYAHLSAIDSYKKGKKASILKIFLAPPLHFFKAYFLKLGFMDGIQGLIVSFSAYIYFFLKYIFLWEKSKNG